MTTTRQYERTPREALRIARRMGKRRGEGAADVQYFPGGGRDTSRDAKERAAAMLKEYDDGYPEWAATPDWLSGEWAGEPLLQDIADSCGIDEERDQDGETAREVCDAYVQAADDAFVGFILRHLRNVAKG